MQLDEARTIAQAQANAKGKPVTICKLSTYSTSNVTLRDHDPSDVARWWFVEAIQPEGGKP